MNRNAVANPSLTTVKHEEVDEAFVRTAVEQADLNALRLALLQATGRADLAEMTLERPVGGAGLNGSGDIVRLSESDSARLKGIAVDFLLSGAAADIVETAPSDDALRRMFHNFRGKELDEASFIYAKDAAAFDPFPRAAEWTTPGGPVIPAHFSVAIIGAGLSGITAAVQLGRLGIPFTVFERQESVGGTWLRNR